MVEPKKVKIKVELPEGAVFEIGLEEFMAKVGFKLATAAPAQEKPSIEFPTNWQPVTNKVWKALSNQPWSKDDNKAVTGLSHNQITAWCRKAGYRLPTREELEWWLAKEENKNWRGRPLYTSDTVNEDSMLVLRGPACILKYGPERTSTFYQYVNAINEDATFLVLDLFV